MAAVPSRDLFWKLPTSYSCAFTALYRNKPSWLAFTEPERKWLRDYELPLTFTMNRKLLARKLQFLHSDNLVFIGDAAHAVASAE